MTQKNGSDITFRKDLCRLAQFGANIADAHSCFVLLPAWVLMAQNGESPKSAYLEIGGAHSLSNDIIFNAQLVPDNGLIGWVAKHKSPIHVSPFDRDSRTLGVYREDQKLKSFIGIPIKLTLDKMHQDNESTGVIACDSKKSFAFSKLQGKLLENLAAEVANTVSLSLRCFSGNVSNDNWQLFMSKAESLVDSLGRQSVEALRLKFTNFNDLEQRLGSAKAVELFEKTYRLIQQALPEHFPSYCLPNGDVIMLVDAMMGRFYENRFAAICSHITAQDNEPAFECLRSSFRDRQYRNASLGQLFAFQSSESITKGISYEYRRA